MAREALPGPLPLAWGIVAGLAGLAGILALYRVLAVGTMSVGSPLVGVMGAGLPAAAGLLLGDAVSPLDLAGVACGLAAVAAVSWTRSGQARGELWRVLPLVVAAGIGFAGFYLAIDQAARAGGETWWPLVAARTGSVLGAAIAVARLRPGGRPSGRWPMIIAIGLGDLFGNAFFVMANAQGALSVAAVLSSLYPVATIVLARLVLGERLRPAQALGVALALVGVALIAA